MRERGLGQAVRLDLRALAGTIAPFSTDSFTSLMDGWMTRSPNGHSEEL